MDKVNSRKNLFLHLEGLAVGPVISCMQKNGVFEYLLKSNHPISIIELSNKLNASPGYLNIALHLLSAINWIKKTEVKGTPHYQIHNDNHKLGPLFKSYIKYVKHFQDGPLINLLRIRLVTSKKL